MNELTNLKTKADLWWRERRGLLKEVLRNPLFLALGMRVTQPDAQTVILRLPWNKGQKWIAADVPLSILIGAAEMALQVHLHQFQVFAPSQARIVGVELDLAKPIGESIEIRLKGSWPDWEELRLALARTDKVERTFVMPLWNSQGRTVGSTTLRAMLQPLRLLGSS